MSDKLDKMFDLRARFMKKLQSVGKEMPDWPVDVTDKRNQLFIKDVLYHGMEELFEALRELKNAKAHRQTDIPEFDKEHFLEEMVDAHNLFLEALVLVGVSPQEFFDAYVKKDGTINRRIDEKY